MAIEKVRAYFKNFGKDGDVQEFTVSSATVELAALALGVDGARIAKSMSFYPKEGEGCIIVVTAGDKKVDNGKFKRQFAMDLCQYFGQKKLKDYAAFFSSSSSFC